jgi:hypothetical protein
MEHLTQEDRYHTMRFMIMRMMKKVVMMRNVLMV